MAFLEDYDSRLTPQAREVLDALIGELRAQTVAEASRQAVARKIGVRDVVEAFERYAPSVSRYTRGRYRRVERLLLFYGLIATILVVVASTVLLLNVLGTTVELPFDEIVLAATIFAFVAASLALLVSARARLSKEQHLMERRRELGRVAAALIDRWSNIEIALRLIAAESLGASAAEQPLGQVIDQLKHSRDIDSQEADAVRRLLGLRNSLMHGRPVQQMHVIDAIEEAENMQVRLESRLESG